MPDLRGKGYESIKYRSVSTKFCDLYFPDTLDESVIPRLVEAVREMETFFENYHDWLPEKRINVVFDRENDMANGWSRTYLKHSIYLYMYPPEVFSSLTDFKSWEKNLLHHEFAHSVQIGRTSGIPRFINHILGNLYYPLGLAPIWLLEGAAIYAESVHDGTGRLNFPLYNAYFDSFFQADKPLSLSSVSASTDHWLGGRNPYLYGAFFYSHLVEKHGEQKMNDFLKALSDNLFPYGINSESQNVLGEKITDAYDTFIEKYRENRILEMKKWDGAVRTGPAYDKVHVDVNAPGYVFYGSRPGSGGIFSYDGVNLQKEMTVPPPASFSFRKKKGKKLLASFNIYYRNKGWVRDLFLLDDKKNIRRLTTGESARYPIFAGKDRIVFFSYRGGINSIVMIDSSGNEIFRKNFPQFNSMYTPSISPDGSMLAFIANENDREKNIFIMDMFSRELKEIRMKGHQYSVSFHDNSSLIASSFDNKRIVPVIIDTEKGKVFKLHNPPRVALFPKIIEDKVFFFTVENEGYVLAVAPVSREPLPDAELLEFADCEKKNRQKVNFGDVSFFSGLAPALILPDYNGALSGHTVGATVLGEHDTMIRSYEISFSKSFDSTDDYSAGIVFRDAAVLPGFKMFLKYRNRKRSHDDNETERRFSFYRAGLGLNTLLTTINRPFSNMTLRLNHNFSTSMGLRGNIYHGDEIACDPTITPDRRSSSTHISWGSTYTVSSNLAPGSRFLSSPMNNTSFSFPLNISHNISNASSTLTVVPSLRFSFLLSSSGKTGFVSRHRFYATLEGDNNFSLGGRQRDISLEDIDAFIYGASGSSTVRAYGYGAVRGSFAYYSNNELRAHLFSVEKGIGLLPVFMKNIQGALFVDYGSAAEKPNLLGNGFIISTGAELKLFTHWWYRVPVIFKLGIGRGLTPRGVFDVYFSLGNSF